MALKGASQGHAVKKRNWWARRAGLLACFRRHAASGDHPYLGGVRIMVKRPAGRDDGLGGDLKLPEGHDGDARLQGSAAPITRQVQR